MASSVTTLTLSCTIYISISCCYFTMQQCSDFSLAVSHIIRSYEGYMSCFHEPNKASPFAGCICSPN
ncbi:hypothetical protein CCACVL1_04927 [Corchorus capsularis]|uniref:Uncharacterized protein n=1 Tax=Corchorus capsularis TaxID=210143 RepID=A0A1R3JP70_COCAP|nr:hypothetical protein CCACVL1_04927 [Corchorus capsularis]